MAWRITDLKTSEFIGEWIAQVRESYDTQTKGIKFCTQFNSFLQKTSASAFVHWFKIPDIGSFLGYWMRNAGVRHRKLPILELALQPFTFILKRLLQHGSLATMTSKDIIFSPIIVVFFHTIAAKGNFIRDWRFSVEGESKKTGAWCQVFQQRRCSLHPVVHPFYHEVRHGS